ncbi:MAG: trehalase-like domain-containing protein, partial [Calditrichia bacterium]
MSYQPLEDYGVIGDLHTVALVGKNGSIDFMCFPHFNSPSIFAALLDDQKGGRFKIFPFKSKAREKQIYLPDTNILLTRFLFQDGVAEISDFMPVGEGKHAHNLVRRVKCVKGEISFRLLFQPRFNYARSSHKVEKRDGEFIFTPEDNSMPAIRLRTSIPLNLDKGDLHAEFTLSAGQTASFILEEAKPGKESPSTRADYEIHFFKSTMNFWRNWISRCQYEGRWRDMVNRSALVLKMLTYRPTGALVA